MDLVSAWLVERFPTLTKVDGQQVRAELEKIDPALRPKPTPPAS